MGTPLLRSTFRTIGQRNFNPFIFIFHFLSSTHWHRVTHTDTDPHHIRSFRHWVDSIILCQIMDEKNTKYRMFARLVVGRFASWMIRKWIFYIPDIFCHTQVAVQTNRTVSCSLFVECNEFFMCFRKNEIFPRSFVISQELRCVASTHRHHHTKLSDSNCASNCEMSREREKYCRSKNDRFSGSCHHGMWVSYMCGVSIVLPSEARIHVCVRL